MHGCLPEAIAAGACRVLQQGLHEHRLAHHRQADRLARRPTRRHGHRRLGHQGRGGTPLGDPVLDGCARQRVGAKETEEHAADVAAGHAHQRALVAHLRMKEEV